MMLLVLVEKITTGGSKVTTTLYLFGNFINDTLQYLPQEEGRVRYDTAKKLLYYDYFVKDHLGNIRMVLTEQKDTLFYPAASLETAQLTTERAIYGKVDTGRVNKSTVTGYPTDTYTNPNDFIQKTGSNGVKVGTGIVLKVMAGDQFNLRVNSWYSTTSPAPNTPASPLNDLIAALAGSIGNMPGKSSATELISSGVLSPNATNFLNSQSGYTTSKPKAFINWILLDERFNYVANSSGFEQVGAAGIFTTHTRNNLALAKSGYLYIYVSNETPNIDVFFDNLQVTHTRGALLEENHFYPFGLTMAGISSKALKSGYAENKKKFVGQILDDDLGLNWYQFKYRNHDPQIGRFIQTDPLASKYVYNSTYAYAENRPVDGIDLEGLEYISQRQFNDPNFDINKYNRDFRSESTNPNYQAKSYSVPKGVKGTVAGHKDSPLSLSVTAGAQIGVTAGKFKAEVNGGSKELIQVSNKGVEVAKDWNSTTKGASLQIGVASIGGDTKTTVEKSNVNYNGLNIPVDKITTEESSNFSIGIAGSPLSAGISRTTETETLTNGAFTQQQVTYDSGTLPYAGTEPVMPISRSTTNNGLTFGIAVGLKIEVKIDFMAILASIHN